MPRVFIHGFPMEDGTKGVKELDFEVPEGVDPEAYADGLAAGVALMMEKVVDRG